MRRFLNRLLPSRHAIADSTVRSWLKQGKIRSRTMVVAHYERWHVDKELAEAFAAGFTAGLRKRVKRSTNVQGHGRDARATT